MNLPQEPPASPCIKCCCLDQNSLCVGCFRTLDEITGWTKMNSAARSAVLAQTEKRRVQNEGTRQSFFCHSLTPRKGKLETITS
ncbi:MAG: DUF1289 domain-containing protein [Methylomicrobium sp.]